MRAFPFTEAEWEAVKEPARAVVNATLADDPVLRDLHFAKLEAVLADLRGQYGDHPVLLETEADFNSEPPRRVALYERAKEGALAHGLPTLSICLSLARVLVEELGQPATARGELLACYDEPVVDGDTSMRNEWTALLAECDRLLGRDKGEIP